MITRYMRNFLENLDRIKEIDPSKYRRKLHSVKYLVYMKRSQKRIDSELDMLLWLAVHCPWVFLEEDKTHGKKRETERLKKLLLIIKQLNHGDVELSKEA